jgi:acetolactate synthase-1/2/3 large subunit
MRGADLVWAALARAGVSRVFSLSGNHIMSLYDAGFGLAPEILHVRHEAAALHMAEAYARLSGEVGVAMVTGGQGHTNACAALPTALAGEQPVLLLSGHAPRHELGLGAFQETPQVAIAAPLCKAAWLAERAETLAEDIARACRIARSGRPGPVHISLPTDLLEAEVTAALPDAAAFSGEALPLAPEARQAVLAALAAAARPVLIAGPSLVNPAGREALARLSAATGLPIPVMESPRGLAEPALGDLASMLTRADLILLLGKPLDFALKFGAAAPTARFVAIEPEGEMVARLRRALGARLALVVPAAPLAAVEALGEAASPGPQADWARELAAAIAYRPAEWGAHRDIPGVPVHPITLGRALRRRVEAGALLVCDGGEIGQWTQAQLNPAERITNGVAGAIGASIPFAIAASAARPGTPVLAVMGDGSAGFHLAEFDTACRHGLPFVAVVGNDSRWNAEHQIQLRDFGANRTHGCELAPAMRYDLAAAGFGAHAEFVTTEAELEPALERAFAAGRPACVNVLIEGRPAPQLRRAA